MDANDEYVWHPFRELGEGGYGYYQALEEQEKAHYEKFKNVRPSEIEDYNADTIENKMAYRIIKCPGTPIGLLHEGMDHGREGDNVVVSINYRILDIENPGIQDFIAHNKMIDEVNKSYYQNIPHVELQGYDYQI